ncbi:LuxR family transcriptional regulator, partial [Mycobacterium sp. ITM-2017-0098]
MTLAEELGSATVLSQALAMWVHTVFIHGHGVDDSALALKGTATSSSATSSSRARASAVNALILAWTGRLDAAAEQMLAVRRNCEERGADRNMMAVA